MYGLIGSIEAVAGRRDELVAILLEATRGMPGCLSYIIAADPDRPDTIRITEVWESAHAHQASLAIPAVRDAIARARPLIAGMGPSTGTTPVGGHGLATVRDTVAPVDDRVIALDARLAVPPADAFGYFTDAARLAAWLAPAARVEADPGGPYELFWAPDDRENDSTIGCRVTAAAPGQLLAFQWRSPRQFKPFANGADPLTHVVVSFHAEDGGTRVRLTHTGWRSGTEWEAARAWQERAWRGALAKLEQVARNPSPGG